MAHPPGTVVAGFTVDRVLGAGGMGTVYLARHPRLPRWDALKLMRADLTGDPGFGARFEREADLAAQLHHRNIVTIYDRGCSEGQLWIDMQYVAGTDCSEVLMVGVLPLDRAVHVVREVGIALDYAHAGGLLHRDVKPANILLAPSRHPGDPEQVLLTDFGIARSINETPRLTTAGELLLTPDYAAPEQIRLERLDHRVDVYALGCVLYELLTGSVPYPAHYRAATLEAHLGQPPPRPSVVRPQLPPGLDGVIATAMAKDRNDRYATCADLVRAAEAAIRMPDPLPQAAMAAGTIPRPARRTPKFLRRCATVVVATATAAAALALPSDQSQILATMSLPIPRSAALPAEILVAPLLLGGNLDLHLVDFRTGSVERRLTTAPGEDRNPSISPDRQTIVYVRVADDRPTLRVMAADGSGDRELFIRPPPGCAQMGRPAWNQVQRDQLAVVCVDERRHPTLQILRTDGQHVRTLVDGPDYVSDPTFSPDGARLALAVSTFAGAEGGGIVTLASDGSGGLRRLTKEPPGTDNAPAWSPDGTQIAFRRRVADGTPTGNFEIYAVDARGGAPRPVVEHEDNDLNPVWSPDGQLIAFMSKRAGSGAPAGAAAPAESRSSADSADSAGSTGSADSADNHLWVVRAEGGKARQVVWVPGQAVSWSSR